MGDHLHRQGAHGQGRAGTQQGTADVPDESVGESQESLETAPMLPVAIRPEDRADAEMLERILDTIQEALVTYRNQAGGTGLYLREAALRTAEFLTAEQAISGDPDPRPADGNRITHTSVNRYENSRRHVGSMSIRVLLGLLRTYNRTLPELLAYVSQELGVAPAHSAVGRLEANYNRLPPATQEQVSIMVQSLANHLAPVRGRATGGEAGGDGSVEMDVEEAAGYSADDALSEALDEIDDATRG